MSQLAYSVKEVGEQLCIGRTAVYRLIKSGELESVRIGRSRRITVLALQTYVAGLRP